MHDRANGPSAGIEARGTQTQGIENQPFSARIDRILSSAIKEKARDERTLLDAVTGARSDVAALQEELVAIRKLAQRPYQPLLSMLGSRLGEMAELVSRIPDQLRTLLESSEGTMRAAMLESQEALSAEVRLESGQSAKAMKRLHRALEERMQLAEESLRADLEVAQEAIFEQFGEMTDATTTMFGEFRGVVRAEVEAVVTKVVGPIADKVDDLERSLTDASGRVVQAAEGVESIQRSLVQYLADRDEKMERFRDQEFTSLIDRMSEAFSRRSKIKLGQALGQADRRRVDHRDAERYRKGLPAENKDAATTKAFAPPPSRPVEPVTQTSQINSSAAAPTAESSKEFPNPIDSGVAFSTPVALPPLVSNELRTKEDPNPGPARKQVRKSSEGNAPANSKPTRRVKKKPVSSSKSDPEKS